MGSQRLWPHRDRSRLRQEMETGFSRAMMLPKLWLRCDLVCQQGVELVTSYLEGTLAAAGRHRFESHLASCPDCTEYLAQMRKTIELAGLSASVI